MQVKYDGPCRRCGTIIKKGQQAEYDPKSKTIACFNCPDFQAKDDTRTPEQIADDLGFTQDGDLR